MKLASGAVILLTLAAPALLSALGVSAWTRAGVLILVFACLPSSSPRDAGGGHRGGGLLFLFFENWFGHVGEATDGDPGRRFDCARVRLLQVPEKERVLRRRPAMPSKNRSRPDRLDGR